MAQTTQPTTAGTARQLIAGHACILLATIFFGVNIPVVKLLIPKWMTAVDVTLWRVIGGCVLMWIASVFVKTSRVEKHDMMRLALGGALGLFSFLYLFNLSLRYGNPVDISIIMTLPPVFVLLIGVIFQHQRPDLLELLGVIVSFAGALIVILMQQGGHAGSDNLLGDLLAVASTICYAFYLVITEGPSKKYRPVNMLRWVFLFASIPALCFVWQMPQAQIFHTDSATPWLLIGFVLLGPTFLSYFLISPAIKLIGSELVSIYQYFLPVVAVIASVWMGIATIQWPQIVAMAVIIGGMALTTIGKKHRKH